MLIAPIYRTLFNGKLYYFKLKIYYDIDGAYIIQRIKDCPATRRISISFSILIQELYI